MPGVSPSNVFKGRRLAYTDLSFERIFMFEDYVSCYVGIEWYPTFGLVGIQYIRDFDYILLLDASKITCRLTCPSDNFEYRSYACLIFCNYLKSVF